MVPTLSAEDNWVLLHRGKGSDSNVYYKKNTIKKIDTNITEVYIYWCNTGSKCALQQMQIDCKNNKTSIGVSDVYINDTKTQRFDFSKTGWIWVPPKNNVDKKLLKLVCKKK
jgi:hypothetical protein